MTKLWVKPVGRCLVLSLALSLALWLGVGLALPGAAGAAVVWGEFGGGSLRERLASYPQWTHPAKSQKADGDLAYPTWFQGDWEATCTLTEAIAPQAPEVNSPGFAGNLTLLDKPVTFDVRFIQRRSQRRSLPALPAPTEIVADRAYNGLNIARAYLGAELVSNVQVDPKNPNRQITTLRDQRQLISSIPARATEQPGPQDFITAERFQQVFRGQGNPYLNQVEITTAYHHQPKLDPPILADQITAVYLSPQDGDYLKVGDRPIAIYKYRLELRSMGFNPA
jgi:hypothetical protein